MKFKGKIARAVEADTVDVKFLHPETDSVKQIVPHFRVFVV